MTQRISLITLACCLFFIALSQHTMAQVGIGTTSPSEGTILDIESGTSGILIPRVALTSKATQAPVTTVGTLQVGTLVFNNATAGTGANAVVPGFYYWGGGQWIAVSTDTVAAWELEGNAGTTPGTGAGQNYIGTTDATDLIIATNDNERIRVLSNGEVGINSAGNAAVRLLSVGTAGEVAVGGVSSTTGSGVQGSNSGTGFGVVGFGTSTGVGVQGQNSGTGNAIVGINTGTGSGGYFQSGDVNSALRSFATGSGFGLAGVNTGTGGAIYAQTTDGFGIINIVRGAGNVGLFTSLTDAGGAGEVIDLGTENGTGVFVKAVDDALAPTNGGDVYAFFAEVRTQTPTIGNTVAGGAFLANQTGVGHGILINHSGAIGRNAEFNITNAVNTDPTIFASHQGSGSVIVAQNQNNTITGTISVADISYSGNDVGNHIAVNGSSTPAAGWGIGIRGIGGFQGVLGIQGTAGAVNAAVFAQGNQTATGVKTFMIDHPQNPENKYLRHFAIESSEVLNLYRGIATFDATGKAFIALPDYYDSINKNPSYQLTPVGASMPNLYVAQEIENRRFTVGGGVPGKKVSWIITAERNDPYLKQNPDQRDVVVDKGERSGKYLTPELYNQAKEKSIFYSKNQSEAKVASKISATNSNVALAIPKPIEEDKDVKILLPVLESSKEQK